MNVDLLSKSCVFLNKSIILIMSDPSGLNLAHEQNLGYDEKIELLVTGTGEIKRISKEIGQELNEQNLMLEEVSQNMDTVKGRLTKYNKQMKEITHSKEGPLLLISVVLTLILIFLVTWVIL